MIRSPHHRSKQLLHLRQRPTTFFAKSKMSKLRPKSMKRAPSPNGNKTNEKSTFGPQPITPIVSPMLKPTFKAIVAKAMEQQKLAQRQLRADKLSAENRTPSRSNSRRDSVSSTNKTDEQQRLLKDHQAVSRALLDVLIEFSRKLNSDDEEFAQHTSTVLPAAHSYGDSNMLLIKNIAAKSLVSALLLFFGNQSTLLYLRFLENSKPQQVSVQIDDPVASKSFDTLTMNDIKNNPKTPVGAVCQMATTENEEDTTSTTNSIDEEQPSVVRQNLFGALNWDDLYYT
ncbi:hypothetical protein M3Y94_00181900 [Aphelenchoides besseyi]|nr:hypothetical protein M3Y94_00181900 [Aphelenchoides besseyi]